MSETTLFTNGLFLDVDAGTYREGDLRADDGGAPPASGSALELQRVYAIVHTVLRNVPDVSHVVLLWNGVQRLSLSGHVDTGHALSLMPALEAR